jgi:hypothetical protein
MAALSPRACAAAVDAAARTGLNAASAANDAERSGDVSCIAAGERIVQ